MGEWSDEQTNTGAGIVRLVRLGENIVEIRPVVGNGSNHGVAQPRRRDKPLLDLLACLSITLVSAEDENFVSHHRASECTAKLIKREWRLRRGRLMPGVQRGAGVVLEHASMPFIRSCFGNHVDISSQRSCILGGND